MCIRDRARRAGRPEVTPMYNVEDAQNVMQHFTPCDLSGRRASVNALYPGAVSYTHLRRDIIVRFMSLWQMQIRIQAREK